MEKVRERDVRTDENRESARDRLERLRSDRGELRTDIMRTEEKLERMLDDAGVGTIEDFG